MRDKPAEYVPPPMDEDSTRADLPSKRPPRGTPASREERPSLSHAQTELVSPTVQEIVARELHRRIELFAGFVLLLLGVVAACSLVLGGDPLARALMLMAMVVSAWASLRIRARLRKRPSVVETYELVIFGAACALALSSAFYYWGVLSGVLVLMPLGAFVFPVGQTRWGRVAAAAFLLNHFVLTALTITGVLADRGLIRPVMLTQAGQWLSLLFADAIAVGSYVIGRQTQFSAERALLDIERAMRAAAQRGELLAEARNDLAQALRAGRAGRFTGQSLGDYKLGVVLGRGAMGEVYEATKTGVAPRAVKLLHLHLVSDRHHYARFVREAQIAASLDVPNVVRVLEASDENAVLPYLVMERLEGLDLGAYLKQVERISGREVVELVRQVGCGLDAAHAVGIVHRDLKPQNLFRAQLGASVVWKVLDFGVSKLLESSGSLSENVVVGTPQYMAPEQARGEAADKRADFYSLGLIAYRALTGRPAFIVNDVRALLAIASERMPPRPSAVTPLPREVDDVMAVAISKDPKDRFASASAFADALECALSGHADAAIKQRAEAVLARWAWGDPTREAAQRT
jgi:eukaryotic-like serine/threonine-protein kinase